MNLRTDDELDQVIERLASRHGLSRQKVVAKVLREADQRESREQRMTAARARVLAEWSETIDILANS